MGFMLAQTPRLNSKKFMENKMLTVYSKDYCPYCVKAKDYLKKGNIDFVEINVTHDEEARNFLREKGHRTVPQIYQNGELFVEGGCTGLMALDYDTIRGKLV